MSISWEITRLRFFYTPCIEVEWTGTLLNAIMRNSVSLVLDIEFRSREMQLRQ